MATSSRMPLIVAAVAVAGVGLVVASGLLTAQPDAGARSKAPRGRRGDAQPRLDSDRPRTVEIDRMASLRHVTKPLRFGLRGEQEDRPAGAGGAPVDLEAALDAFETAIDEMDTLLDRGGKVDRKTRRRLYEETTDAFEAMSMFVDGQDPDDRRVLERAYNDMLSRFRALGIDAPSRVRKPKASQG